MTPVWTGRCDADGRVHLDAPQALRRYLRLLRHQTVEIVVRRRSQAQKAWVWGVASPRLAEACGLTRGDLERLPVALVARGCGTQREPRLGLERPVVTSATLSPAHVSDYMAWLVRVGASLGIRIPLPDDEEEADPAPAPAPRHATPA